MYDFYKILEIPRDANLEVIKKAYRSKAKLVHPDVNNSPKAHEVFTIVTEAYKVLSDEQKRYIYDIKMDYIDAAKTNAERKKIYYGSSVKNNTYSNFHYDWISFDKIAHRKKTDEDYYKRSPFFYNSFFASGMFLGFLIIAVTFIGTLKHFWPFPFILICLPGLILVREGWRGIMKKKNLLTNLLKIFKKNKEA